MVKHDGVKFSADAVTFNLGRLRAREMSLISRTAVEPQYSWDHWAAVMARVVTDAPGMSRTDADAWLDLDKDDFEALVKRISAEMSGKN